MRSDLLLTFTFSVDVLATAACGKSDEIEESKTAIVWVTVPGFIIKRAREAPGNWRDNVSIIRIEQTHAYARDGKPILRGDAQHNFSAIISGSRTFE
jgi:hypothetical protein